MKKLYDLLIIGGGPGGYTAALYAARAGLSVAVLEKLSAGGQMALTDTVDNYPGFPEGIDGFALGENMQTQAERFGAVTVLTEVQSVNLSAPEKEVRTDEGTFWGKTLIIATGAGPKKLGFEGGNVHYCAACDGMRYKGKTVVVVGGGNSAVADALVLSRIAEKAILVHRRDTLRATKVYHQSLTDAPNVEFLWNSAVTGLTDGGVSVKDLLSGEEKEIKADGLFVSIGRQPATELVKGQLVLDENGYIIAGEDTVTSLPGVYAVGDVRTKAVRQIVTAMADGAVAAHMAEAYLAQN